jgi:hypothetical protein
VRRWQGLGYNNRAQRLRACAAATVAAAAHGRAELPRSLTGLRALPGIGPYTARAVLVFAHNDDFAAVDANVRRVLTHELGLPEDLPGRELQAVADFALPRGRSRDWHNALMDYGSMVLTARSTGIASRSRQSAFPGSRREKRARLLRRLLEQGPQPREALAAGLELPCGATAWCANPTGECAWPDVRARLVCSSPGPTLEADGVRRRHRGRVHPEGAVTARPSGPEHGQQEREIPARDHGVLELRRHVEEHPGPGVVLLSAQNDRPLPLQHVDDGRYAGRVLAQLLTCGECEVDDLVVLVLHDSLAHDALLGDFQQRREIGDDRLFDVHGVLLLVGGLQRNLPAGEQARS